MSASVDSIPVDQPVSPPPAGRWRRVGWWLLPELLVLALLAGLFWAGRAQPDLPERLNDEVARILERVPPAEHHDHGHQVSEQDTVLCVAEVFGMEPAGARTRAQVRTVYATYMCAAGTPGTPYERSQRIAGPVAVVLSEPPAVRIAQAGLGYQERVRALIPPPYVDRAFAGFVDHELPLALRHRYESEVAGG
jgi:hypothetical protein